MNDHLKIPAAAIMLILFIPGLLFSQTTVRKIDVSKSSAVLYFTILPKEYDTKLSEDKKKITIDIPTGSISEDARSVSGKGKIESIYGKNEAGKAVVNIMLKKSAGFTAAPLPYSKAVKVDIFSWDELTPAEDNYHSGLLALEDNIEKAAEKYFSDAADAGHEDAAAFLGIMYLSMGESNNAVKYLHKAIKGKTGIYDTYAAASQLLEMKDYEKQAKIFADHFREKTGIESFPDIAVIESDEELADPWPLLELAESGDFRDSLASDEELAQTDTSDERFGRLFDEGADTTIAETGRNGMDMPSLVPEWLSNFVLYTAIIILVMIFVLGMAYVKWRKKRQEELLKKSKKKGFEKDLKSAQKQLKPQAKHPGAAAYEKSQKEVLKDDNKNEKKEPPKSEDEITRKLKDKDLTSSEQEKLYQILSKIEENKLQETKKQEKTETAPDEEKKEDKKKASMPGKLQLAMHLQEEQRKLKNKNIESLKEKGLPVDADKLSEIAKKLGIEKGGLEVKKALSQIEKDKKAMSELEKKFKSDKNK